MRKRFLAWLQERHRRAVHRSYIRGYNIAVGHMLRGGNPSDLEDKVWAPWPQCDTAQAYDEGILDGCKAVRRLRHYSKLSIVQLTADPVYGGIEHPGLQAHAVWRSLDAMRSLLHGETDGRTKD